MAGLEQVQLRIGQVDPSEAKRGLVQRGWLG